MPGPALSVRGFSVQAVPAVNEVLVECHSKEEITQTRVHISENEANLLLELCNSRRDATTRGVVKGEVPA